MSKQMRSRCFGINPEEDLLERKLRELVWEQCARDPSVSAIAKDDGSHHTDNRKYEDAECWMKENEYVRTGYRRPSTNAAHSIESMSWLHNETVNIHLHLEAAKLFAVIPLVLFYFRSAFNEYPTAGFMDTLVFGCFFYGVASCFFLSVAYHTLSNCQAYAATGLWMDHLGIILIMWGTLMPTIYYGFWCHPLLAYNYGLGTTILAMVCGLATALPQFAHVKYRNYRTAMFATALPLGMAIISHAYHIYGKGDYEKRLALGHLGLMACCHIFGAVFYVIRIPEKWYPVHFDLIGASHQIFHLMIVVAALVHMRGLSLAFTFAHGEGFQCAIYALKRCEQFGNC